MKVLKIAACLDFLSFSGSFSVIMGSFSSFPKFPKIFPNTYRTTLNLCELNSVDDIIQFEYKFGALQILQAQRCNVFFEKYTT